jgi:hypothetical protein
VPTFAYPNMESVVLWCEEKRVKSMVPGSSAYYRDERKFRTS